MVKLKDPLISLVIPTRERSETLFYTLTTALAQNSLDYEVVISDNCSADNTKEVVDYFNDKRLRYFKTEDRLSMCDNYEFALSKSRGEYVIIIGDDDAVIPGRLDDLITCLKMLPEPIIHMWPLHIYDWPVDQKSAGVAYLAPEIGLTRVNLKEKACFTVSSGGWKYYELPSVYHSAIPIGILNQIRERTGRVFHSTQPDVFTAMAIPAFADFAINLGKTVTFNGRSSRSNGLGFIQRKARVNIKRFINEYGDYKFHPSLYEHFESLANMIPDAVLLAKEFFPEVYKDVKFSYSGMLAYMCRLRFIGYVGILRDWNSIKLHQPVSYLSFFWYSLIHELSSIRRKNLNTFAGIIKINQEVPNNINEFAIFLADRDRYSK